MDCGGASATRRPSAMAQEANARGAAAAHRITSVDINPQFVVIRDFSELRSTIQAIRAGPLPIRSTVYDDDARALTDVDFTRSNPSRSLRGSIDHTDKSVSRLAVSSPTEPVASPTPPPLLQVSSAGPASPLQPQPPLRGSSICRSHPATAAVSRANSAIRSPVTAGAAAADGSRRASTNGQRSPMKGQPGEGKGASSGRGSPGAPPLARKLLCIWDVDDTLVASGAAGVRQNAVFPPADLLALFKSLPGARHLLLSQGSIDDVFYPGNGRLRYLQRYFNPSAGGGKDDKADSDSVAGGKKKKSGGASSFFTCGGTKEKATPADAPDKFEKGTALVRLTMVQGCAEEPDEADFMYDENKKPRLHGQSTKDVVRWLVLRPSTWGITLAPLNSMFAPSRTTACVDGKVFHKMDVVWSLARSGLWDSVFFIDNNLSEVGLVRHGMNMSHVWDLQSTHSMYRFFQSEFLVIAASAKLRELEKQHGRDVTRPPPKKSPSRVIPRNDSDNGPTESDVAAPPVAATASSSGHIHPDDANVPSDDSSLSLGSTEEADPSPSGSPVGPAPTAAAGKRDSSHSKRHGEGGKHVNPLHLGNGGACNGYRVGGHGHAGAAGGRCREVDLVVAHLHMPSAAYHRILMGNRSGTDVGTRNSGLARVTSQPTFMGDSSLTDEQYEAVLALFRQEESTIYQLMDEDMRSNGYVGYSLENRMKAPRTAYVHMPVYRRPVVVPHMLQYYQHLCDETELRVAQPLLKGGGSIKGASVIRGDAHILCTKLLRGGPFIDPRTVGTLAVELFMVYTAEGNISKASGDYVRKAAMQLNGELDLYQGKPKPKPKKKS